MIHMKSFSAFEFSSIAESYCITYTNYTYNLY